MNNQRTLTTLVCLIALLAGAAAACGIFLTGGAGVYTYESIRGLPVEIYGYGLYRHMSGDVAIQGIAQDYVTLFLVAPLLLFTLRGARRGSIRHQFVLSGALLYILVTYLFYLSMGMYNVLFLVYAALLGLSFFALFLSVRVLDRTAKTYLFSEAAPAGAVGWFLVVNALAIAFLWLSIVVPPLLDGTIYPPALQHYTTLIVQGLDLGLLLPISLVLGLRLIRKRADGYRYATVYLVFLSILMSALTAKLIAMGAAGVNVFPAVVIIPVFLLLTVVSAVLMVKHIRRKAILP